MRWETGQRDSCGCEKNWHVAVCRCLPGPTPLHGGHPSITSDHKSKAPVRSRREPQKSARVVFLHLPEKTSPRADSRADCLKRLGFSYKTVKCGCHADACSEKDFQAYIIIAATPKTLAKLFRFPSNIIDGCPAFVIGCD